MIRNDILMAIASIFFFACNNNSKAFGQEFDLAKSLPSNTVAFIEIEDAKHAKNWLLETFRNDLNELERAFSKAETEPFPLAEEGTYKELKKQLSEVFKNLDDVSSLAIVIHKIQNSHSEISLIIRSKKSLIPLKEAIEKSINILFHDYNKEKFVNAKQITGRKTDSKTFKLQLRKLNSSELLFVTNFSGISKFLERLESRPLKNFRSLQENRRFKTFRKHWLQHRDNSVISVYANLNNLPELWGQSEEEKKALSFSQWSTFCGFLKASSNKNSDSYIVFEGFGLARIPIVKGIEKIWNSYRPIRKLPKFPAELYELEVHSFDGKKKLEAENSFRQLTKGKKAAESERQNEADASFGGDVESMDLTTGGSSMKLSYGYVVPENKNMFLWGDGVAFNNEEVRKRALKVWKSGLEGNEFTLHKPIQDQVLWTMTDSQIIKRYARLKNEGSASAVFFIPKKYLNGGIQKEAVGVLKSFIIRGDFSALSRLISANSKSGLDSKTIDMDRQLKLAVAKSKFVFQPSFLYFQASPIFELKHLQNEWILQEEGYPSLLRKQPLLSSSDPGKFHLKIKSRDSKLKELIFKIAYIVYKRQKHQTIIADKSKGTGRFNFSIQYHFQSGKTIAE